MNIQKRVIVVDTIPETVELGNRLIQSGENYNCPDIKLYPGINPIDHNPIKLFHDLKFSSIKFEANPYSKPDRAMSCFLSHYYLWKECASYNDMVMMIFEHDAVFTRSFDDSLFNKFKAIVTIGAPSFGRVRHSNKTGLQPLFSKNYIPGAHSYIINSYGAKELVKRINGQPEPTDVYINTFRFPSLIEEYTPYYCNVDDSFSTVQEEKGCIAKYSFQSNPHYKMI